MRLTPGVRLPRAVKDRIDSDGWTVVRVPIESVGHAHGEFLRRGADIEVLEPPELRQRMARTIAELAERYGNSAPMCGD